MTDCSGSAEPGPGIRRIAAGARLRLPFSAVNRPGRSGYDPGLQRHHLLPRQVLHTTAFSAMFDALGRRSIGFDDFTRNGLLLPATCEAAVMLGLPLHRGPHRIYTAMVLERVGAVEREWAARRGIAAIGARRDALFRLALLQRALRRSLLRPAGPAPALNRQDPARQPGFFAELDAMADRLWPELEPGESAGGAVRRSRRHSRGPLERP